MASKVTFKLRLDSFVDTSDLKKSTKDLIKKEVGEFIVDSLLEDASDGRSSVSGQLWKGLSPDYKKIKSKVATAKANLELHGDYLNALEDEPYRDGIEFGFFDEDQAKKADNHNKFSAKARKTDLPKRQSIPNKKNKENLRSGIMKEAVILAQEIIDAEDQ